MDTRATTQQHAIVGAILLPLSSSSMQAEYPIIIVPNLVDPDSIIAQVEPKPLIQTRTRTHGKETE